MKIKMKSKKEKIKFSKLKKLYYFLVDIPFRYEYWHCSSFADWLRVKFGMNKNLSSGTAEEWKKWETENKEKSPIGYWIVDVLLDTLQDIVFFPSDVFEHFKLYFIHRFIDKSHYIDTKLKRGKFYEIDNKILHGMFELLVDFVEIENAHKYQAFANEPKKNNPEDGIKYLDWEISLGESSPLQSKTAAEVKELYLWWTIIRPKRKDVYEESGWDEYDKSLKNKDELITLNDNSNEKQQEIIKIMDSINALEEKYKQEETEMLIRLIKIRENLWT